VSAPAGRVGVIYTLHFRRRYHHAGHYTGWTESPESLKVRLATHARGAGAKLLAAVRLAGITWELAVTQPGTRSDERRLKQHGAARRCPICRATRAPGRVSSEVRTT
jgi:hypothetical protein